MRFNRQFWMITLLWSAIFLVVVRLMADVEGSPIPGQILGIALALGICAVAGSAVALMIVWNKGRS